MAPSWQKKCFICPHSVSSTCCSDLRLTIGRITWDIETGKEKILGDVQAVFKHLEVCSVEDELGSVCVFPETEHTGRDEEWEGEGNKI